MALTRSELEILIATCKWSEDDNQTGHDEKDIAKIREKLERELQRQKSWYGE